MSQVSISHLRHLIRTLGYVVSTHAADELADDNLSFYNLESIVPTGQVTQRQRDASTRETKYVVRGSTRDGQAAEAGVKIGRTGRLVVVTVYLC
jgi:hypothetical protein